MYGPPGHTYVYFIYGIHWLFNITAHIEDTPGAILIRAVEPMQGIPIMQRLRGLPPLKNLTNGPARLAQAFNIDRDDNDIDLVTNNRLYLVEGSLKKGETIAAGPRVRVPGDTMALTRPWRFRIDHHPYLSS
jgi:DNA-3-methyladenine glycosylase